ncbi:MAG: type II 3-dehydroquinate dehydratase [bacterium]
MSREILVLFGPNLALLGRRETEVYGTVTLDEIRAALEKRARDRGRAIAWVVSNHEGELVDALNAAVDRVEGILVNPGGLTHTSVALRDALLAVGKPSVEVHLSNIHAREEFRRRSLVADVVTGQVSGLGAVGVVRALDALLDLLDGAKLPAERAT